ncbi:hypothetical protein MHU86_6756 [Fragilaria crotonensis]|nr:hypothetical protein MHU86_6756 [Fragilaria crotonensis]
MTTQFANDINEAYVSDPSQVMARSENNPDEVVMKICQVASNMKNIDEDMRKLAEAKSHGKMTADNGFTGFSRLGEEDYLQIDEASSQMDSSEDSEASQSTSDSDDQDSDDVSEWDSDDESSLDSNFMAEMANELGFDIDDDVDDDDGDETINSSIASRSMASRRKFIPHFSSMMKVHEASTSETHFTDESCCDSSINTEVQSRSYYPANFKAGGVDTPETSNWMSSQHIMPKSYAAIKAAEYREPQDMASPALSVHHGYQGLTSVSPQTEFDGEADSGGEDCDVDDAEASDDESTRSLDDDDDLIPIVSSPWAASRMYNEPHACTSQESVVTAFHDRPVTPLPLARAGATIMPEPDFFAGLPQSPTGTASSYQPSCSPTLSRAATPPARKSMSQPASSPKGFDHQSESDDDSNDDSEYDSDDDSNAYPDVSDNDSDGESDYLAQFESSLEARPARGRTLPAVPLHGENLPESANVPSMASQSSLKSEASTRALQAVTESPSGIGTNVGCFDASGKPNKMAAIRGSQRLGILFGQDCRYLSDLSIAARLAGAVDEDVAPFGPAKTASRQSQASFPVNSSEIYKSAPCAVQNRCSDEIGESLHHAETVRREVSTQGRLLPTSFNNNTDSADVDGKLLVDWNTSDSGLLVSWGDGADSDSDACVEARLVGRDDGSQSDDEFDQKPIVSNWNARQNHREEGVAVKRPSDESVPQPCHFSCDASPVRSDRKLDVAERAVQGSEFCVDYPQHANVRDLKEKLFIGVDFRDSDGISPVSTVTSVIPRVANRERSWKGSTRRQASARRVSFHDAFKTLAQSEDDLQEQNVRRDLQREAVFPRVDFRLGQKRRTRRLKKGEGDSQSTRRRRKHRENEIKSVMGIEKCYIEGLCMIDQSQGKTIACKMKSQI